MAWEDTEWVVMAEWPWWDRSVEEAAARWLGWLDGVGACVPLLGPWVSDIHWPPAPIPDDATRLAELIRSWPSEDHVGEERYRLAASNMHDVQRCSMLLSIVCSIDIPISWDSGSNGLTLVAGGQLTTAPTEDQHAIVGCIVQAIAERLDPAWATASPQWLHRNLGRVRSRDQRHLGQCGMITYVPTVSFSGMDEALNGFDVTQTASGVLISARKITDLIAAIGVLQTTFDEAGVSTLDLWPRCKLRE